MASVFSGDGFVRYSIHSGRVDVFELDGVLWYDAAAGVELEGWEDRLVAYVRRQGLHQDIRHAFVHRLRAEGRL
jgi:hypothetical protein